MTVQSLIRRELEKVEFKISVYTKWFTHHCYDSNPYFYNQYREHLIFYSGRRRFYLKELLNTQLKEFIR